MICICNPAADNRLRRLLRRQFHKAQRLPGPGDTSRNTKLNLPAMPALQWHLFSTGKKTEYISSSIWPRLWWARIYYRAPSCTCAVWVNGTREMSGRVSSALPRSERWRRRRSLSCLRNVWAKRKLGVQTHIKAQIRSAPLSVVTSPHPPGGTAHFTLVPKYKKKKKSARKKAI